MVNSHMKQAKCKTADNEIDEINSVGSCEQIMIINFRIMSL